MSKLKLSLLFIVFIAIILVVSACSSNSNTPTPTTPTQQPAATVAPSTTLAQPNQSASQTPTTTAAQTTAASQTPTSTTGGKVMKWSTPPALTVDKSKKYTATIKTNYGDIVVNLFASEDPVTVNNFVFLANQGFYNGVKFHRIVPGFVIQSGDPTGTGSGGPGYKFADEPVTRNYVQGTLAMANSGPNTNGSQFFITLADLTGGLPKNYTIFGLVTADTFNVVQKIGNLPVANNPQTGEKSSPTVDVLINTVTISVQ